MASTPVTIGGQTVGAELPSFVGTSSAVPGSGFLSGLANSSAWSRALSGTAAGAFLNSGDSVLEGLISDDPTDITKGLSTSAGKITTDWTALFLRGVIIILGFIFVAVGLTMFKSPQTIVVNTTANAIKRTAKGVAKGK